MTISWQPVESSNIDQIGYDDETEELHVLFNSGKEYIYHGIPADVHEKLLDAESKGKYLNQYIKGAYEFAPV